MSNPIRIKLIYIDVIIKLYIPKSPSENIPPIKSVNISLIIVALPLIRRL